MPIFWFFFRVLKYFGNSLKLFNFGFIDPINVPTLNSKFFLVSINIVSFFLINLFHSFGVNSLSEIFFFIFMPKGTNSFFILILPLLNAWNLYLDKFSLLNFLMLKIFFKLLAMLSNLFDLKLIVPFNPSLEIIIVPLISFLINKLSKNFFF